MSWRAAVVGVLVVLSLVNSVMRLWGDWATFFAVLGAQTYFIFAGIYPYFFNKMMLAFPMGGADAKFNPNPTDTNSSLIRSILMFVYTTLYFLMFLAA